MNWAQILTRALKQTHTNPVDYTTADIDMDIRYQELIDEVVSVWKEDHFWDIWTTDTVIGQNEYIAEKLGISPDDLDIKKVNKVFIKYSSTDQYFTKARYIAPSSLDEHPEYYSINQPVTDPFFYIQDNSIFIYPAPSAIVTGWLELFVIHKPEAIDTTTLEVDIELPIQFHKLISDWLRIDIYLWQGKENEAQAAQTKYNNGIRDMVKFMKQRYNQPIKRTFKNNLNSYR